jgi:hypothetical protein
MNVMTDCADDDCISGEIKATKETKDFNDSSLISWVNAKKCGEKNDELRAT